MSHEYSRFFLPLRLLFGLSVSFAMSAGVAAFAQDGADSTRPQTEGATNANGDDPNLVTYPENEEPNEVPGNNSVKPRPVPAAKKQALQRRAGEQIGNLPRGRAVVLGMHIQEANQERARVVEVAPASPAFDAGIRKGDEIVSFDGFKAATYREWIDGMRRLAGDAPDGDTVPIELMRHGKKLALRLRIPVANAGVPPTVEDVTLNQTVVPNPGVPPTGVTGGQQPILPSGVGHGGDTLIADELGDDFDSPMGDNRGRAIAEIFRLNVVPEPAAIAGTVNRGNATEASDRVRADAIRAMNQTYGAGARVGIAGFRNDANGMFVILDVGGLPAGKYLVGIGDPAILNSGSDPTTEPNVRQGGRMTPPTAAVGGGESTPNRPLPPAASPPGQLVPKSGVPQNQNDSAPADQQQRSIRQQPPANPSNSGTLPQSKSNEPKRFETVPATILAQVSDSSLSDVAATRSATPRTEFSANGVGPALQIGMITVDQRGAGRLQQVVEAVRVQDVIGQAIVIYAPNANPRATLPPNLNAGANPSAESGTPGTAAVGARQRTTQPGSEAADAAGREPATAQPPAAIRNPETIANANSTSGNVPIAGGLIQFMTDGLPGETDGTAKQELQNTPPTDNAGSVPQNSATPRTGQSMVR